MGLLKSIRAFQVLCSEDFESHLNAQTWISNLFAVCSWILALKKSCRSLQLPLACAGEVRQECVHGLRLQPAFLWPQAQYSQNEDICCSGRMLVSAARLSELRCDLAASFHFLQQ